LVLFLFFFSADFGLFCLIWTKLFSDTLSLLAGRSLLSRVCRRCLDFFFSDLLVVQCFIAVRH
jgi:hypothetical protein